MRLYAKEAIVRLLICGKRDGVIKKQVEILAIFKAHCCKVAAWDKCFLNNNLLF